MNLQIDAGNTRVKWRVRTGLQTLAAGAGHQGQSDLLEGAQGYPVQRVLVSAVTSEASRRELSTRVAGLFGCIAEFYGASRAECGVRSAYGRPCTLGADRWHGLVAARADSSRGHVIVDAGSALTVDFLGADGGHLGGYILPGRRMMQDSLQMQTAKVAFEDHSSHRTAPGTSTQDCVNSGMNWLGVAVGDRVRAEAQRACCPDVLVTGGDAARLLALGFPGKHRPDLVLDGLEIAAGERLV